MPNPLGVAVTAAIVTVVLTPAVACVVLRRFRGAVTRSMLAAGTVEMLEVPQVVPSRLGGLAARATGQVRRAISSPAPISWPRHKFFCHDDTWRPALRSLLQATDVVLVDLRALDRAHEGVAYEVQQLAAFGVLDRVVGLVDDTTDMSFLQSTLAASASESATATGSPACLRVVHVRGQRAETHQLLQHLETASIKSCTRIR